MNSLLMSEYRDWVKQEGHLVENSSSVLKAFIEAKNYTQKEYEYLAKAMKF